MFYFRGKMPIIIVFNHLTEDFLDCVKNEKFCDIFLWGRRRSALEGSHVFSSVQLISTVFYTDEPGVKLHAQDATCQQTVPGSGSSNQKWIYCSQRSVPFSGWTEAMWEKNKLILWMCIKNNFFFNNQDFEFPLSSIQLNLHLFFLLESVVRHL